MRMDIDFRHLKVCKIIIIPLTGQKKINTIIHVSSDDKRDRLFRVGFHCRHILIDHINKTVLIDDRRCIPNRVGKLDRSVNKMQIVLFSTCTCRAQTPTSLFTRFSPTCIFHIGATSRTTRFSLGNNPWIGMHMKRFQPGSTTMVTREWNSFTKMRRHMWPC